jgi:16S rRNA (guanine966-N2)-methyltransferase
MNRPPPGQVRIIGGRLRGSKLPVPDLAGLRPSAGRARETLFNWLQGELAGARVLDLFAGSGALGFEAASRGAADVWLVERDASQARSLAESAQRLHADVIHVACAEALRWLAGGAHGADTRFDIAFLDPPFAAGLWDVAAAALHPWLADPAWIYVELAAGASFNPPPGWRLHRESGTREARHLLFQSEKRDPAATLGGSFPGAGTASS